MPGGLIMPSSPSPSPTEDCPMAAMSMASSLGSFPSENTSSLALKAGLAGAGALLLGMLIIAAIIYILHQQHVVRKEVLRKSKHDPSVPNAPSEPSTRCTSPTPTLSNDSVTPYTYESSGHDGLARKMDPSLREPPPTYYSASPYLSHLPPPVTEWRVLPTPRLSVRTSAAPTYYSSSPPPPLPLPPAATWRDVWWRTRAPYARTRGVDLNAEFPRRTTWY
ncbi:hypothetical protein BD413DRAFT_494583 [Trametes elegans]|nr:hypothetical protein BD413DRAFT_494583 [Trametes elegans]